MAGVFITRSLTNRKVRHFLLEGDVGIIPTDTIYGLVGSALSKLAVSRIYKLRKRDSKKPMIIIIGSLSDIQLFGVKLNRLALKFLNRLWPGKVSVVLPRRSKNFWYLYRGTKTLAFRLPAKKSLRELVKKTGPLVAPSANIEGKPPAMTVREAKKYFGSKVDFYVDGGKISSKPSTLVAIKSGKIVVLRKGAVRL